MRCFGIPVVPPVSKILNGRPWYFFGTQTSFGRSRSHSSWKCGKRSRSAKHFTSVAGFQPAFFAQSSQKGVPVSGEKCHWTISRTWASSLSCAALMGAESGFISNRLNREQVTTEKISCSGNYWQSHRLPAGVRLRFGKILVNGRPAGRAGEQREENHAQRRAKNHRHHRHIAARRRPRRVPEPDVAGRRGAGKDDSIANLPDDINLRLDDRVHRPGWRHRFDFTNRLRY